MTLGALIATHGYWVLSLGCLVEGETVLVLAGFAAHRGYLDPIAVIGLASAAGFAGDEFFFWLGRRFGDRVTVRFEFVADQADRVRRLIDRHGAALVIGLRFAYGLRIAGPVLVGTTPLPALRFAVLNACGALLWACVVAGVGWVFGEAAELILGRLRHLEGWLMLAIVVVGALVWVLRRRRSRIAG